jgi:hypothetical protein
MRGCSTAASIFPWYSSYRAGTFRSPSTPKHELSVPVGPRIDTCCDRRHTRQSPCQTHSWSALSSGLKLFRAQISQYVSLFAGSLLEKISRGTAFSTNLGERSNLIESFGRRWQAYFFPLVSLPPFLLTSAERCSSEARVKSCAERLTLYLQLAT